MAAVQTGVDFMNNNRRSLLLACFILVLMLAGPLCHMTSADNDAYGEAAWQYLQVIDQNFPSRITNVAVTEDFGPKKAAGAWIRSTLEGFGYNVTETTHMAGPNECITYRVAKPGNSPKKLVIGAHYDCVATKGVEDNGTGVSLLLELAARFINTETPLTLEFCFWDAEEYLASFSADQYVQEAAASGKTGDILLYINLDSIGSGDHLYVYGGDYREGNLTAVWGLNLTDSLAKRREEMGGFYGFLSGLSSAGRGQFLTEIRLSAACENRQFRPGALCPKRHTLYLF